MEKWYIVNYNPYKYDEHETHNHISRDKDKELINKIKEARHGSKEKSDNNRR